MAVYINKIAKFFPNKPISNDEIEDYLGLVNGKKSLSKDIVLSQNQITTRYYAYDKTGKSTHTNAQLTAEAVKQLFDSRFKVEDVQLLACGTTTPDQLLPSHSSMVHGEIKGNPIETVAFAGSCCSGMHAFKYGYLSILSGEFNNAVITGSEKTSSRMLAKFFTTEVNKLKELDDNPILAFEKEFLRWMLSDGAVAVLLENKKNEDKLSLKVEWIELSSFANELKTCMYSGASKDKQGDLTGWAEMQPNEWAEKSIFAIEQDVVILEKNIGELGIKKLAEVLKRRNVDISKIDYFLPHLSSGFFKNVIEKALIRHGLTVPPEKWFMNLFRIGNIGSASIFLALEELYNSQTLKKGQQILLCVPESARFAYGFSLLTVC